VKSLGKYLPLLIIIFAIFFGGEMMAQCAMCKEAAASSLKNDPTGMARSLNSGILYLMAVPYLLLAFIFRKQIVSLYRKLKGKEESTAGQ
jgi:hypothetical protein